MTAVQFKNKVDKKGLKQKWIADNLGVSKALVSRWYSGSTPIASKHLLKLKALLK